MFRRSSRALICIIAASASLTVVDARASALPDDVFSRVKARGFVRCAGIVRPGIAVPTADGKRWYGIDPDICRSLASAVFGDPERMTFRPYFGDDAPARVASDPDDVVFLSGAELVGPVALEGAPLVLGPAIVHDSIALLVPSRSSVQHVGELANKTICVEPGTAADRAITAYFADRGLTLHEHPFQETDEMRQAYGDGKCDALAGPSTTLGSVRADPLEGHPADRILPEVVADDPIFAATYGDARWARIVWWTFSVLVDAEDDASGAGVPPAVGRDLSLPEAWSRDVLAGGDYAKLFDRNLGMGSRLKLTRGENELWRNGGELYGLYVE